MKISYFANIRLPTEKAHGRQIMKMAESLAQAGDELELIIPSRQNPNFQNTNPFRYYQIKETFKIKKINCFDPVFLFGFPAGLYIKFQTIFFILSLTVYLLINRSRQDTFFYTRDEALLPLLSIFSKKIVWEAHALPKKIKFLKPFLKRAAKFIVLTQSIKKNLISLGLAEEKILVSPDAVDLEIFGISLDKSQAREQWQLPQDKIILGYTGTIKTKGMDKGLIDIFQALKILSQKRNDLIFIALGGLESEISEYQKLAENFGVADFVKLLSPVEQNKLAAFQQACDILLMPFPKTTHFSFYMSPLKMFEYLSSGRPIIATNLPSIKEILDNTNAILIKPGDFQDLAEKIELLLNNPSLANDLAQKAKTISLNYSWQKRGEKIYQFLCG